MQESKLIGGQGWGVIKTKRPDIAVKWASLYRLTPEKGVMWDNEGQILGATEPEVKLLAIVLILEEEVGEVDLAPVGWTDLVVADKEQPAAIAQEPVLAVAPGRQASKPIHPVSVWAVVAQVAWLSGEEVVLAEWVLHQDETHVLLELVWDTASQVGEGKVQAVAYLHWAG